MNEEYAEIKVSIKIKGQEEALEITIPNLSEEEFFRLARDGVQRNNTFKMAFGHLTAALEEKKIIPLVLEIGERKFITFSGVYDVVGMGACQITMYTEEYPKGKFLGVTAKGAFRLVGESLPLIAGTLLHCEHRCLKEV